MDQHLNSGGHVLQGEILMVRPTLHVLLVDDDDVAIEAVTRSFQKNMIDCKIIPAENGVVAFDILRNNHPERTITKPFLILLDLNMPQMNGFEFLQALRADIQFRDSVVFVLTTSDSDQDRTQAYDENIAGYMTKSSVGPQFKKLASLLEEYCAAVILP